MGLTGINNATRIIVEGLFPITKISPSTIIEGLILTNNTFLSILKSKYELKWNNTYNPAGKLNSIDYREYLQIGNTQIKKLAAEIVKGTIGNDEKADKILQWVQANLSYVFDEEQYHFYEYWAKPTETLESMKGDCEDGSYLIHSLLLAAGIPATRIRTYGGLVKAGTNAPLGGHAWTIYEREDGIWVDLDWCYLPDDTPVSRKESFKSQDEYVDAYWWMNAFGTYDEYGKWGIDIYA